MPTKIEWTQETWNPITGCTKVSEGCRNCYAARMAKRLAGRYGYPEAPHEFDVTLHPNRLDQPLHWKKPRTVFVCSMSDLFHRDVPFEYISQVFKVMALAHQHTFQVLTKRPDLMLRYFWRLGNTNYRLDRKYTDGNSNLNYLHSLETPPGSVRELSLTWPLPNVWLGASVENQATADERHKYLYQCLAAIKFVSYEPALSAIDWTGWESVSQIISGGESGPGARPSHPDWHRATRDFCQTQGIPFFFKQIGAWLHQSQTSSQQRGQMFSKVDRLPTHVWPDDSHSWRVGKHYAGRLLDGRTWSEMPKGGR